MTDSLVTFLFEIANFVAFVLLLGWLFIKPVRKFLDEQAAADAQAREAAQRDRDEARRLHQEAREKHQQLAESLEEQRVAAVAEAREQAQQQISAAEQEIAQRRDQLRREMQRERSAQQGNLAQQVAQATGVAVSRLLTELQAEDLNQALVASACGKLNGFASAAGGKWIVESAHPLKTEQQQLLVSALAQQTGDEGPEFRVNPELIGGVRLYGPEGMVDHSIAGLTQYIQRQLKQDLTSDA